MFLNKISLKEFRIYYQSSELLTEESPFSKQIYFQQMSNRFSGRGDNCAFPHIYSLCDGQK